MHWLAGWGGGVIGRDEIVLDAQPLGEIGGTQALGLARADEKRQGAAIEIVVGHGHRRTPKKGTCDWNTRQGEVELVKVARKAG